jgi:hypothetical protein
VNHKEAVILLTFLVSITPSLSDMVQVNDIRPGAYLWVLIWYVILLLFISGLWEHIS